MPKSKVLLIEDDPVLAKVLNEELREAGFEIFQAYDGDAGLSMAREKLPDLILLDIMLPKKSGFEVLESLKSFPETKAIPVALLTMLGSDDDVKKGLQLGASEYIVKSQHALPEIMEMVKKFLDKEGRPQANQPVATGIDNSTTNTPPSI